MGFKFQDLPFAMKRLGLNPTEQETVDIPNKIGRYLIQKKVQKPPTFDTKTLSFIEVTDSLKR